MSFRFFFKSILHVFSWVFLYWIITESYFGVPLFAMFFLVLILGILFYRSCSDIFITKLNRRFKAKIADCSSCSVRIVFVDAASSLSSNMSCFSAKISDFCPKIGYCKLAKWSEAENSEETDEYVVHKPRGVTIDDLRKKVLADSKARVEARAYRPRKYVCLLLF